MSDKDITELKQKINTHFVKLKGLTNNSTSEMQGGVGETFFRYAADIGTKATAIGSQVAVSLFSSQTTEDSKKAEAAIIAEIAKQKAEEARKVAEEKTKAASETPSVRARSRSPSPSRARSRSRSPAARSPALLPLQSLSRALSRSPSHVRALSPAPVRAPARTLVTGSSDFNDLRTSITNHFRKLNDLQKYNTNIV